jgi:hypothetical protein
MRVSDAWWPPDCGSDEDREEQMPADGRTPEEKEANRARIRAWLARPDVNAFLQELKRLDPKDQK